MAELATLARPYALAVFKLARDKDKLAVWSEMLAFLGSVIVDPLIRGIVANPRIQHHSLAKLLIDICGGRLTDEGQNFIRVLTATGRLNLAPEIARLFEIERADIEGRATVNVTAAYEVNPKFKLTIAQAMKKHLDREVDMEISIDKSLIGGAVIRAGDIVIDVSLRGRLNELAVLVN